MLLQGEAARDEIPGKPEGAVQGALAAQRPDDEGVALPAVLPQVRQQVCQLHHLGIWRAADKKPADVDGGHTAGDPDLLPGA
ncbi:hypothetical protein D3C85_1577050 [compost metagenome]